MSLTIERQQMPFTTNVAHQGSAWKRRKETTDWRTWAATEAAGGFPLIGPVKVCVVHLRKNRAAMPDTGAPYFAAKAVIDGLVDAGIIPEDGPAVVRGLCFHAPEIVGYHGLRVTVRESTHPTIEERAS